MNRSALIKLLSSEQPPETAFAAVRQAGQSAVPALLAVLQDESQWGEDEDGDGAAAVHAAQLLGELKVTKAIEPMLDALEELEIDSALCVNIVEALVQMGAAVLEPALQRCSTGPGVENPVCTVEVLARCGVRDPRVLALLNQELEQDPAVAASLFAHYGDPPPLARLVKKLDGIILLPGTGGWKAALTCLELTAAIRALGGELTAAQEEKNAAALAIGAEQPEPRDSEEAEARESAQSEAEGHVHGEHCNHDHDHGAHGHAGHVHGEHCNHDHDHSAHGQAGHVHGEHCNHDHEPQAPRVRSREKLGRNEPCWCGSGKKYKKCHHDADQRALY